MYQLIILCVAIFLGSCGPENPHVYGLKAEQIAGKKTRILPSGFVECNTSFYWTVPLFETSIIINSPYYTGPNSIVLVRADNTTTGPFRSGTNWSSGFDLTQSQATVCHDIKQRIDGDSGTFMEYRFLQSFDLQQAKNVLKDGGDFQPIETGSSFIDNKAYRYDGKKITDELAYVVTLPLSTICENPWMIKSDPQDAARAILKAPDGKCRFSLENYTLELSSGKKIQIALQGYYENDPEYPDQRLMVMIERYGFEP